MNLSGKPLNKSYSQRKNYVLYPGRLKVVLEYKTRLSELFWSSTA
jgi:hypothetical protein